MKELEGEGIREMLMNRLKGFLEWLKPNPADSLMIQSLKMVYKSLAVLVLIALSPVMILIMIFVFFAAL